MADFQGFSLRDFVNGGGFGPRWGTPREKQGWRGKKEFALGHEKSGVSVRHAFKFLVFGVQL